MFKPVSTTGWLSFFNEKKLKVGETGLGTINRCGVMNATIVMRPKAMLKRIVAVGLSWLKELPMAPRCMATAAFLKMIIAVLCCLAFRFSGNRRLAKTSRSSGEININPITNKGQASSFIFCRKPPTDPAAYMNPMVHRMPAKIIGPVKKCLDEISEAKTLACSLTLNFGEKQRQMAMAMHAAAADGFFSANAIPMANMPKTKPIK